MFSSKLDVLRSAYGRLKVAADGINIYCHCPSPNCPTKTNTDKLKLVIRIDDGRYHCWVCGIKGRNIADLTGRFMKKHHELVKSAFPTKTLIIEEPKEVVETFEKPELHLLTMHLNSGNRYVDRLLKYLFDRGLDESDLWRHRLSFSTEKRFYNRIIIPSFDECGELNYYVTRTIDNKIYPRYINAPIKRQSIIFNEIDIDWHSEVILTEGPFDAISCGGNVTCLLGNSMDTKFKLFRKIVEHSTPVLLALDAEEIENTKKLAKLLYSYDINVRIIDITGHKDLGSMPRQLIMQKVDTAQLWSPQTSLLKKISSINNASTSDLFLNI